MEPTACWIRKGLFCLSCQSLVAEKCRCDPWAVSSGSGIIWLIINLKITPKKDKNIKMKWRVLWNTYYFITASGSESKENRIKISWKPQCYFSPRCELTWSSIPERGLERIQVPIKRWNLISTRQKWKHVLWRSKELGLNNKVLSKNWLGRMASYDALL